MNSWRMIKLEGLAFTASILVSTVVAAAGFADLLPMRAIAVEGGLISVRGGVMRDPSRTAKPLGKLRYPSVHFVVMKNESSAPFWAEVEMRPPKEKPKRVFWGPLPEGKEGLWKWETYDAAWAEPIPVRISVYGDKARTKRIAEKEMTMYIDDAQKDLFHAPQQAKGGAVSVVAISGWREMSQSLCSIEGTAADEELLWDVCRTLWKYESVDHLDCEHRIAGVERLNPAKSTLLAAQPEEVRGHAEAFVAKGDLILEKWVVKSCDTATPYEVMLIKAPQGGTDIMAAPIRP